MRQLQSLNQQPPFLALLEYHVAARSLWTLWWCWLLSGGWFLADGCLRRIGRTLEQHTVMVSLLQPQGVWISQADPFLL